MLVLPYHPAERPIEAPEGFDGTHHPEGLEHTPRRYAIVRTNRIMVDSCDWLICYVRHSTSNSWKLLEYARKREKKGVVQIINGCDDVLGESDRLDEDCVNAHTDDNEEALEAESEQGSEIVLSDLALFSVAEGGKRDRCKAGHQVNLHHPSVDDDEDQHRQNRHCDLHNEGLQEQTQKRANFHGVEIFLHCFQSGSVYSGTS